MQNPLVINLSSEEQAQLEVRASAVGLTPGDYVRALIHADVEEDFDIRAEFIEAWREARRGEGVPLDEMWAALNDEIAGG